MAACDKPLTITIDNEPQPLVNSTPTAREIIALLDGLGEWEYLSAAGIGQTLGKNPKYVAEVCRGSEFRDRRIRYGRRWLYSSKKNIVRLREELEARRKRPVGE